MATDQAQAVAAGTTEFASAPSLASASSLPTALTVGWLLAELELDVASAEPERQPSGSLAEASIPGSAAFLLAQVPAPEVRVRQIQAKLFLLQPDLHRAGVPPEASAAVKNSLERLAAALDPDSDAGSTNGDRSLDQPKVVKDVTQDVLANLTAASARMGRAFGLGYDLANTCELPVDRHEEEKLTSRFGERVVDVQEALADLSSSLPPHAARGVSLSLAQWQYWAVRPTLGNRPVSWPHRGISEALARQGQVWRAVLSGEKLGTEMLAADDYLGALKALARRLVTGRPWVWLILLGFVILTGLGIYLLVAAKATVAKVIGIVLSALGAVGIRTASLKQGFSDVAKEIEAQVWGTEVDFAVAQAITVPPGDWSVDIKKINTPPPRGLDPHIAANSRTVGKITNAISVRRPKLLRNWLVQKHLHDRCEYHPLDGLAEPKKDGFGLSHRLHLAQRIVSNGTLGIHPDEIKPGAWGRLASHHHDQKAGEEMAVVWTFHHGRLIDLGEFKDYATAEAESTKPQHSRLVG